MRKAADLYPGKPKTDARDAFIIADTARAMTHTLRAVDRCRASPDSNTSGPSWAEEVEKLLDDFPLSGVLMSMPGVGITTAAAILLTIGDGSSFRTAGHLAACAGIAPVTRRSGTSIRGEYPARSRSGNKELKNALFRSAWIASCHDPVSKAYYARKRAEGKKHNAAVICLARRRCDVIHAMLRNGTLCEEKAPQPA
jgi:hypothetical protein